MANPEMTIRFCTDCAHCAVLHGGGRWVCTHPLVRAQMPKGVGLVGNAGEDCSTERGRWAPWAPCGRKGKLWDPKPAEPQP